MFFYSLVPCIPPATCTTYIRKIRSRIGTDLKIYHHYACPLVSLPRPSPPATILSYELLGYPQSCMLVKYKGKEAALSNTMWQNYLFLHTR